MMLPLLTDVTIENLVSHSTSNCVNCLKVFIFLWEQSSLTYSFAWFLQSAILGMHSIVNRPMVVGGQIVSRPMMYIALTYDHRLIDGREAVFFLRRIKDVVEDPRRLLLDI